MAGPHADVGHIGILGLDVALQFVQQRAMRLSGVGERLGFVCSRRMESYADEFFGVQHFLLPCPAGRSLNCRRACRPTYPSTSPAPISPRAVSHENHVTLIRGPDVKLS